MTRLAYGHIRRLAFAPFISPKAHAWLPQLRYEHEKFIDEEQLLENFNHASLPRRDYIYRRLLELFIPEEIEWPYHIVQQSRYYVFQLWHHSALRWFVLFMHSSPKENRILFPIITDRLAFGAHGEAQFEIIPEDLTFETLPRDPNEQREMKFPPLHILREGDMLTRYRNDYRQSSDLAWLETILLAQHNAIYSAAVLRLWSDLQHYYLFNRFETVLAPALSFCLEHGVFLNMKRLTDQYQQETFFIWDSELLGQGHYDLWAWRKVGFWQLAPHIEYVLWRQECKERFPAKVRRYGPLSVDADYLPLFERAIVPEPLNEVNYDLEHANLDMRRWDMCLDDDEDIAEDLDDQENDEGNPELWDFASPVLTDDAERWESLIARLHIMGWRTLALVYFGFILYRYVPDFVPIWIGWTIFLFIAYLKCDWWRPVLFGSLLKRVLTRRLKWRGPRQINGFSTLFRRRALIGTRAWFFSLFYTAVRRLADFLVLWVWRRAHRFFLRLYQVLPTLATFGYDSLFFLSKTFGQPLKIFMGHFCRIGWAIWRDIWIARARKRHYYHFYHLARYKTADMYWQAIKEHHRTTGKILKAPTLFGFWWLRYVWRNRRSLRARYLNSRRLYLYFLHYVLQRPDVFVPPRLIGPALPPVKKKEMSRFPAPDAVRALKLAAQSSFAHYISFQDLTISESAAADIVLAWYNVLPPLGTHQYNTFLQRPSEMNEGAEFEDETTFLKSGDFRSASAAAYHFGRVHWDTLVRYHQLFYYSSYSRLAPMALFDVDLVADLRMLYWDKMIGQTCLASFGEQRLGLYTAPALWQNERHTSLYCRFWRSFDSRFLANEAPGLPASCQWLERQYWQWRLLNSGGAFQTVYFPVIWLNSNLLQRWFILLQKRAQKNAISSDFVAQTHWRLFVSQYRRCNYILWRYRKLLNLQI
jgi:hypothetical protein